MTTRSVYDAAGGLPVLLDDGTRSYVWGAQGLAYSVETASGALSVAHTDGLGSVRALGDSSGSVVQTSGTDEFGIVDPNLTAGSTTQPMQYTGERRDSSTGLIDLRARVYAPGLGRFLQDDAVPGRSADPRSLNRYGYVRNNPIRFTDPSGRTPTSLALAAQPDCEARRRMIQQMVDQLQDRFTAMTLDNDLYDNWRTTPKSEDVGSWEGHRERYEKLRRALGVEIQFFNLNCGGPSGLPSLAEYWSNVEAPSRPDPRLQNPPPLDPSLVGGAVVVGGAGYLAYRVLRLLPSLLFPPSLAPNVLIP